MPNPRLMMSNGKPIDLFEPEPELFDIRVIARALSRLCRYVGHTSRFYSVAEHSVLVASILPDRLKLWGLLHDASEAFYGDLHAPLKHTPELALYRHYEGMMAQRILEHFGVFRHGWSGVDAARVKEADNIACATEVARLMPDDGVYWQKAGLPDPVMPSWDLGLLPGEAEAAFMWRFNELMRV